MTKADADHIMGQELLMQTQRVGIPIQDTPVWVRNMHVELQCLIAAKWLLTSWTGGNGSKRTAQFSITLTEAPCGDQIKLLVLSVTGVYLGSPEARYQTVPFFLEAGRVHRAKSEYCGDTIESTLVLLANDLHKQASKAARQAVDLSGVHQLLTLKLGKDEPPAPKTSRWSEI